YITLAIYLIGFVALWFHMTHGFWSAFQSLGANNSVWIPRLKVIGSIWATVVCGLFAIEAIVFTAKANCPKCQKTNIEYMYNCKSSCCKAVATECTETQKCCKATSENTCEKPCKKGDCQQCADGKCTEESK
ncbi:MAG: hypothetical protein J1F10_05425, partial [Muribaculaceae bacterium]|nr:hypothetical protein [Muribaculaceae bacterium]